MVCYFGNSLDAFMGYGEKIGNLTKVGVENKFRQKTACLDMSTSCLNKLQKIDTFGHLVWVWFVLGSPKYLVFWAFRRKNELQQAPSGYFGCDLVRPIAQ